MNRWCLAVAAAIPAALAQASVGPDIAAQLQGRLTPLGAERAGNAAGTIPAWDGGLVRPAAGGDGQRYLDPFADDQPLFVISRDNLAAHAASLTPGQRALFERYDSYALPVYGSRRSYAAPAAWYAGTAQNATRAFLDAPEGAPQKAVGGVPFPVPADGNEAIWNHRLRWRGPGRERCYVNADVPPQGSSAELTRFCEQALYRPIEAPPERHAGQVLAFVERAVLGPDKLRGALKLIYDTLLPPALAWQLSPGQLFIARTSLVGNDTPALGSEGLLSEDQAEGYNGSPARYAWKLEGKAEIYVPYNAYRLHGAGLAYTGLLNPHHLNPQATRYELHRVWRLSGKCRPQQQCLYPRRTLYLDEDGWEVLLAESYDFEDRLVVFQEVHTLMAYDRQVLVPALETVYDLRAGRYMVAGMGNQEPEVKLEAPDRDDFDADSARRWARRLGARPE